MRPVRLCRLAVALLAMLVPVAASAQVPLPLEGPVSGRTTDERPAEYTVVARSAGVLSVAVQGTGDLMLQLLDEDGQTLPDGTADRDLNDKPGTELLSVTIGEPGTYRVHVRMQAGKSSEFQIGGALLPFPPFARPADPDRRPAQARALQPGKPHEDTLDPGDGDAWDWFAFKVPQAGSLVVLTRPLDGTDADLVLEVFTEGDFSRAVDRSDQDLQDNTSNESVTVNVAAGQIVHVRVTNASRAMAKYRLSSSFIP